MPDTITNSRDVRLSITLHPNGTNYSWSLAAITTRKGVPRGHIIARGQGKADFEVASDAAILELVSVLARESLR